MIFDVRLLRLMLLIFTLFYGKIQIRSNILSIGGAIK